MLDPREKNFKYKPHHDDIKALQKQNFDKYKVPGLMVLVLILSLILLWYSFELGRLREVKAEVTIVEVPTVIDIKQFNQDEIIIEGYLDGVLAGTAHTFIKAAAASGVDPYLLVAICLYETGYGKSDLAVDNNNICGCYNSVIKKFWYFNSVEESIYFMARNLRVNYIDDGRGTLEAIGAKYAPEGAANDPDNLNQYWILSVRKIYEEMTYEVLTE